MREALVTTTGSEARTALGQPTLLPPSVTLPTYLLSPSVAGAHPATTASIPIARHQIRATVSMVTSVSDLPFVPGMRGAPRAALSGRRPHPEGQADARTDGLV